MKGLKADVRNGRRRDHNFADLAKAVGIHGIRVEDPADLKAAVEEAFKHDGPALLDVVVDRMELSMASTELSLMLLRVRRKNLKKV